MSTPAQYKTIRQLKDRAAEIRRQDKSSIPRSLDLAAREHGFASFEQARSAIAAYQAEKLAGPLSVDYTRLPAKFLKFDPEDVQM